MTETTETPKQPTAQGVGVNTMVRFSALRCGKYRYSVSVMAEALIKGKLIVYATKGKNIKQAERMRNSLQEIYGLETKYLEHYVRTAYPENNMFIGYLFEKI